MKKIMKTLSLMFAVGAMLFGSGLHHEETKVAKAATTATATFGTNNVKIASASVDFKDNQNNSWNVTTSGTTSFTQQPTYSQVGSSNKPASEIVFSHTLSSNLSIDSFSIKMGGFNGTKGTINIKAGNTTIGTGSLSTTSDITVSAGKSIECKKDDLLKIEISNIDKGIKIYNFSWSYTIGGTSKKLTSISVTPLKTEYTVGESISSSDIEVIGKYNDGSSAEITNFSINPSGPFTEPVDNLTITVSVDDIEDKYTVNVKKAPIFKKLSSIEELVVGAKITFVSGEAAIGAQSGNIRTSVSATFNIEEKLNITPSIATFEIIDGSEKNSYSFFDGIGLLSWSTGNSLNTTESATADKNSSWTISLNEDGSATILNCHDTTRKLQYNKSSPRFACYTSTQTAISIYIEVGPNYTSLITENAPEKINYYEGQEFESQGLNVYAISDEGDKIEVTNEVVWQPLNVGDISVFGTWKNLSVEYSGITVNPREVISISVNVDNVKKEYYVGDTLDTTGIIVTATWNVGETSDVTSECEFTPLELNNVGIQTITVSYKEQEATYDVLVTEDSVSSLSLIGKTTKFSVGDLFTIGEDVNLQVNYLSGKTINIPFSDFEIKGVEVTLNNDVIELPYTLSLEDNGASIDINYCGKSIIAYSIEVSESLNLSNGKYIKVNGELEDWTGTYLIVYEDEKGNGYVFNGVDAANGYVSDTINDSFLIHANSNNSEYAVTIEAMEGGYSLLTKNGYISGTSGSNKLNFNTSNPQLNTISFENDHIKIVSNTSVLTFNPGTNDMRFRYYKSYSYSSMKSIQLYKYCSNNEYYLQVKSDLLALNTCASDSTTITDAASIQEFKAKLENINVRVKYLTEEQTDDFKNTIIDDSGLITLSGRLEFLNNKALTLVSPKPTSFNNLLSNLTSSNNTIFVLIVGLLGLTSILGYYFLNKKKYSC